MTDDPNHVAATEFGRVRLFSTELDPPDAAAINAQNFHRLLGKEVTLDPAKVEVINSLVLEGLGLRSYLTRGYGVAEADLAGKAAALDALTGLIILIPSSAFMGVEQSLDPNPAIRFIGVFHEERARPPEAMPPTASATGTLSSAGSKSQMPHPERGRSWIGALGALLIAAALVLFFVL